MYSVMKNVSIVMVPVVSLVLKWKHAQTVMVLVKRLLFKIRHLVVCKQFAHVLDVVDKVKLLKNLVKYVVDKDKLLNAVILKSKYLLVSMMVHVYVCPVKVSQVH